MLGIDIVDMKRIQLKDSFIRYILTEEEQILFSKKTTDAMKVQFLAGRFAAKEAIYKATHDPSYLSYSILNKEDGTPYIKDHPELQISISHDAGIAAVIVFSPDQSNK